MCYRIMFVPLQYLNDCGTLRSFDLCNVLISIRFNQVWFKQFGFMIKLTG